VHPTLIPAKRLIANVEGAMNAVLVQGDAVGATLYYGKGAGAEPTASAVIADLVDVTRLHTADPEHRVPHLAFQPDQIVELPILPIDEVETATTCACVSTTSRACSPTSPASWPTSRSPSTPCSSANRKRAKSQTDIIILTHLTIEKNMNAAIAKVESLDSVTGKVTRLRLENL
jgi:homoserine dehydrogenase